MYNVPSFEPVRHNGGALATLTAEFPVAQVLVTYVSPTGDERAFPWPGQALHLVRVNAPGINPVAVQSAEAVISDCQKSGPATVRVTYQVYEKGEHIASADDEEQRRAGLTARGA